VQGFNLKACLHLAHTQWYTWVLVLQACLLAPLHIHNWSGFLSCMQGHKKACLNTLHITLTNTWFLCHVQGCNKVHKFSCTFAHSQLCMDFGLFAMVQEVLLAPLKMMHNWAWFLHHVQGCKKAGLLAPCTFTLAQGFCVVCKVSRRLACTLHVDIGAGFLCD